MDKKTESELESACKEFNNILNQHFQKQPDGWDVVKEIYEFVKNTSNGIKEQEEKGIEYSASGSLQVAQIFIEKKLKEAEIKLEEE